MALIETWFVKNNTAGNILINDIMVSHTVIPGALPFDLIGIGNTAESVANSIIIRNANLKIVASGANAGERWLDSNYSHLHDDFSLTGHTHIGLDILTAGTESDADALHTHDGLTTVSEVGILIDDAIVNIDLSDFVAKAGSITQLSDITSEGSVIEDAISKAHEESHSLLEHIDDGVVTTTNLTTLMDGSNADCLHTHSFQVHNDLTGLDGGEVGGFYHLTQDQHDTLTDGSNADALHIHSGTDRVGIHNDLDGLQGGDISNDEMYHLTLFQEDIVSRFDIDSAGITFDGVSLLDSLWRRSGNTLSPEKGGDNVLIETNSKLHFGENQESSIYFDGTDLNITLNDPSMTGVIKLTDTLNVDGHINPIKSCEYDLGSLTRRWNNIYYCGEIFDTSGKILQERFVDRALVNGTFRETFDATVTSDGSTVTLTVINTADPSFGDLTMQSSDGDTILDTPSTIELTDGSDSSPQVNYIYILQSDKILTKSESTWPLEEHIRIGFFYVQSASGVVSTQGALINQNWNSHLSGVDNQGHLPHSDENIRLGGAKYFDGVGPNGDSTTYLVATASNVEFKSTSGSIFQLHKQVFSAFDTEAGDIVHVKNWFGDSFHSITNLFDITADSTGTAIPNNRRFNLIVWGVQNKSGQHQTIMINLPSGFYNSLADAQNDVSGFDDFTIPREFGIDSSVGFLVVRMTIQMGDPWIHESQVDLRGTTPQTASHPAEFR